MRRRHLATSEDHPIRRKREKKMQQLPSKLHHHIAPTRPVIRQGEYLVSYCKLCDRIAEPYWSETFIDRQWKSPANQQCPHCKNMTCLPVTWSVILHALDRKPHRAAHCVRCGERQPFNRDRVCLFCGERTLRHDIEDIVRKPHVCRQKKALDRSEL